MVVEITPIGIQNLAWKFYVRPPPLLRPLLLPPSLLLLLLPVSSSSSIIPTNMHAQIIWTVLNLSFVPLVYFFYVETAGRTLEDIDTYFREHHNVIVFRDTVSLPFPFPPCHVSCPC
jgi:hypothetical protein